MTTYPAMNEEAICKAALERAEAAMQEAVAREAVLVRIVESAECIVADQEGNYDWKAQDTCEWAVLTNALSELRQRPEDDSITAATATLLERLAELETQVADLEATLVLNTKMMAQQCDQAMMRVAESDNLRGALQAVLPSLEAASGALTLPGEEMTNVATELIEEAIIAIQKELA